MYAEGLQSLANTTDEVFDLVDTNLQKNNRNFAILHRDLSALDDERVTEDTLPFYNRIVLGNDIDEVAGKSPEIGILRSLSNNEDTRDFIDILQMETIIKLSSGIQNFPTREFTTMVKKFNSSPLVIVTGKQRKGERSLFELQFGFTMNTRQDNYLLSKRSSDNYGSVISDCTNNDAGVY